MLYHIVQKKLQCAGHSAKPPLSRFQLSGFYQYLPSKTKCNARSRSGLTGSGRPRKEGKCRAGSRESASWCLQSPLRCKPWVFEGDPLSDHLGSPDARGPSCPKGASVAPLNVASFAVGSSRFWIGLEGRHNLLAPSVRLLLAARGGVLQTSI